MVDIQQPDTPINYARMQNFVIFEPASQRVKEIDILLKGPQLLDTFHEIQNNLEPETDISKIILCNRIQKIGKMLDLVTNFDNIIMTKFLDRIWRRYSYLSNLGETFLDLNTFLEIFPEHKSNIEPLLALRLDDDEEEEEEEEKHAPDITYQEDIS